uniref:Uncharacterized protein n=1 Tax=Oryza brachyantha TaxID=4533 RepID=J3NE30_ORYBR
MSCKMRGCDMPAFLDAGRPPCDCGFMICKECYAECVAAAGNCPGCKEAFSSAGSDTDSATSDDDEAVSSSEERDHLPLTSMARKFSVVHSMKVPGAGAGAGKPAEFDHARWLFETKGTYGYGNALWPKDGHAAGATNGFVGVDEPPNFGARCRRPLTRKTSISQAILSPYRLLIAIRMVALGFFLSWRIRHPNPEAVWLWAMSVACEVWFAFSWLLDSLPKLCPVPRAADLAVLAERFESPTARNPKGRSDLPGIDVFVTSADPEKEPPLVTANTVLSILAADYPVEKLACYLSDDGGALLSFEALAETASFARTWDVVTGYRMHNRGWRSVYCVTRRDAFRGTAPINLTDRLHQVLRWATGSVEIFFSRNNALFASPRMKLLQRVAYFNAGMYPFTSVFLLVYCLLPAVSLFSGKFIVQHLSATFLVFLLVITLTLCLLALLEIKWSGITLHEWWRNEQFWVIGGTSAHPAAVLQGLLKVVAGVDISFTLTSKPTNDGGAGGAGAGGEDDAFAELYEVRWSFLMVPPVTIMMVNAVAIAVAAARTLYSEFPQWSKLLGGAFFSFWVLCHLYPFAKGLLGRRGRVPTIVFVWSGLISMIISLLWVYISPPAGARERIGGGGGFSFP